MLWANAAFYFSKDKKQKLTSFYFFSFKSFQDKKNQNKTTKQNKKQWICNKLAEQAKAHDTFSFLSLL